MRQFAGLRLGVHGVERLQLGVEGQLAQIARGLAVAAPGVEQLQQARLIEQRFGLTAELRASEGLLKPQAVFKRLAQAVHQQALARRRINARSLGQQLDAALGKDVFRCFGAVAGR
jgi:hypothetical protein